MARHFARTLEGEASARLAVGLLAMAAFVTAGIVQLWVGLPVATYLLVALAALALFAVSWLLPVTAPSRQSQRRFTRSSRRRGR